MYSHVIAYLLAALLFVLSPEAILHVIVTWDHDYNGVWEGVGPGVPVWVGKAGNETLNYTDDNSTASYIVQPGVWLARAQPPPTRLFYRWICGGYIWVLQPDETLVLICYEKFFLTLPWMLAQSGGVK